ncbi:MAG TPA: NAD-dependent epimerase/dehydratase family protein [Blastocatellia bacterium]|nr:NAD-dependent epimerase/dehydratase family protein [Blastocatellia bacterium]
MTQMPRLDGDKVLVTGGAGFVGSNVVRRLLERGAQVTVLDDFYTGSEQNLPSSTDSHSSLEVVRGTVTDFDLVSKLVAQSNAVLHLAARNIIVSTHNPREDYEVNIGGTLNVLLAAREARIRRVVYSSSASVYGNSRYLPVNEDDATNMLSPYAVSKFAGENYCKAFYESYGLSTAVVRYSNVYGPGQSPDNPYCGVVSKFFEFAMKGESPRIHGDGEQTRDFTYVDDAVEATLMSAFSPKAEGQVYNVGTGRETSVNQLVRIIIDVSGAKVQPAYIDRRDIDNIRRRVVNIEKIRRELRWVPSVTIEQGLKRTHEWLKTVAERTSRNSA